MVDEIRVKVKTFSSQSPCRRNPVSVWACQDSRAKRDVVHEVVERVLARASVRGNVYEVDVGL